jgi:DNA-directed RNA polymerase specialized sigma24 family protein
MTNRELLENYRMIVIEIETLEKQSKFLNQFIGGPRPMRSVRLTGMPRGTNDPEAAILQRADYDDELLAIEEKARQLQGLLYEFERLMESIPDKVDAIILRDYYALGWTDKYIGKKLGYDKSTIWKRRNRAVNALD